jgi:hypothetical protein
MVIRAATSRSLPHDHHRRTGNSLFRKSLEASMCLALLIVVFHIIQRGESRLGEDVEALCARIIDRTLGFDGEDVGFAVLFVADIN